MGSGLGVGQRLICSCLPSNNRAGCPWPGALLWSLNVPTIAIPFTTLERLVAVHAAGRFRESPKALLTGVLVKAHAKGITFAATCGKLVVEESWPVVGEVKTFDPVILKLDSVNALSVWIMAFKQQLKSFQQQVVTLLIERGNVTVGCVNSLMDDQVLPCNTDGVYPPYLHAFTQPPTTVGRMCFSGRALSRLNKLWAGEGVDALVFGFSEYGAVIQPLHIEYGALEQRALIMRITLPDAVK